MPQAKQSTVKETDKQRADRLEQENVLLSQKNAKLEEFQQESTSSLGLSLTEEIKEIRKKGRSTAGSVVVKETTDHKNISLWTPYGKRIGPMHPDNAIRALQRFAEIGMRVSVNRPTGAQIDAFWKSPQGKAFAKAEASKRARKDKSRKAGQMERLSASIAAMTGTTVEAINKIMHPDEVGKRKV